MEESAFGQDLRQVAEDRDAGDEVAADVIDHIRELGQSWGNSTWKHKTAGPVERGTQPRREATTAQ